MKALILCHGEPPSGALLARHVQGADVIVCTDGAADWAVQAGVPPHVVVGDMDSATRLPLTEIVDCGAHDAQDNSDAEKALLLALERGAERVVILGATGKRLDHTLANVWLVARYHERAEILLADDWSELRVISGRFVLPAAPGQIISLLALTPDVTLDTAGLRWPLHGPLEMGTRGLSNEAGGDEVVVDVKSGLVAVITPVVR